jgi:hypothetical protein
MHGHIRGGLIAAGRAAVQDFGGEGIPHLNRWAAKALSPVSL